MAAVSGREAGWISSLLLVTAIENRAPRGVGLSIPAPHLLIKLDVLLFFCGSTFL